MNLTNSRISIYNFSILISLILITGGCVLVYWPGLDGIFLVDDYPNLSALSNNGGVTDLRSLLAFVFGNEAGAVGRPLSMLSFLLNDQYWPASAESFKYTNLMIHLLCGMLVLLFCYRLSRILRNREPTAIYIAMACAALWLFHPLNVSTTLYVIQRMAQLSMLFSLIGILFYCQGRLLTNTDIKRALILVTCGVTIFGLLSVLSKENGVLILVYILVLEATIFNNLAKPKLLKYWFWLFIYAPLGVLFLYFAAKGFYLNSYEYRDFTLTQRLLTENRILLDYLHSVLIPHLYGSGLINDDIIISKTLFDPFTTIISVLINASLLICAIYFRKKQPVFSFAVLWFYGGHLLESTFLPLELYFEHRNYMPMVGPIYALIYYLYQLSFYVKREPVRRIAVAFPILLVLFSAFLTHKSAMIWSTPGTLFSVWVYEHPNSLRAQRIYGQFLGINNQPELAIQTLNSTYQKFPYDVSLPMEIINLGCRYNIETPYSLDDINNLVKTAKFTDGILTLANTLVDNIVNNKCENYDIYDAIKLLAAIETIPNIERQKKTFAKLLFLHSDLYVLARQLTPAIELLDRAYKYQRRPAIPIRQATLLASAGLYEEALRYLDVAKSADQDRKILAPSELPQLLEFEARINRLIDERKPQTSEIGIISNNFSESLKG